MRVWCLLKKFLDHPGQETAACGLELAADMIGVASLEMQDKIGRLSQDHRVN